MNMRRALLRAIADVGYRIARAVSPGVYAQDGLVSVHNHDFMREASFVRAYARGRRALGDAPDYRWHWRIHVGLWAAVTAAALEGDFVECGVNRGFLSSAIMDRLDWDRLGRTFWLLDTFAGLDPRYVSDAEQTTGALERSREELAAGFYVAGARTVIDNFAEWKNVRIVVGSVPDTLPHVTAERVAYLHLDMNCAPPEVAALEHFWPRLVSGAVVLLDDYAYLGFESQKRAMDEFAGYHGIAICSLPTGQGLLLRPPH